MRRASSSSLGRMSLRVLSTYDEGDMPIRWISGGGGAIRGLPPSVLRDTQRADVLVAPTGLRQNSRERRIKHAWVHVNLPFGLVLGAHNLFGLEQFGAVVGHLGVLGFGELNCFSEPLSRLDCSNCALSRRTGLGFLCVRT
jgi:hypothetical protein